MRKFNTPINKKNMFQVGRYSQFRKGDVYREPRIQQKLGENDFLVIDNVDVDYDFLEKYLANELPNYPSEEYNMFTTGVDKNATPMVGLYWVNEEMEHLKKAIVLCNNGSEDGVLELVDKYCVEGSERTWEKNGNTLSLKGSPKGY